MLITLSPLGAFASYPIAILEAVPVATALADLPIAMLLPLPNVFAK